MQNLKLRLVAIITMALGFASSAFAVDGPDLSSLTAQVSFTTVIAAVLAVYGAIVLLSLAIKGGRTVIAALRARA